MIETFLYRLTSPSGKQYIGVTTQSVEERLRTHAKSQTAIGSALRKYGARLTSEILVVGDEKYIYEMEDKAIIAFNTMAPNGYNLVHGGNGGRHTEASRRKLSEARKGMIFSETHKQNLSKARGNRSPSKETRQNMSVAQKTRRAREDLIEKQNMSQKIKEVWATRSVEIRYIMGKKRWETRRKRSA